MVCSAKLNVYYELNYSAQTVFDCLTDSLPRTKIVRAHPTIEEINENNFEIKCKTPGYKTQITVVPISEHKSTIRFFLKPLSFGQIIDLWNRNKKNVNAIMEQLLSDLNNFYEAPEFISDKTAKFNLEKKEVGSKNYPQDNNFEENAVISYDSQEKKNLIEIIKFKLFYWSNEDGTVKLAKTKIITICFFILLIIWDRSISSSDFLPSLIVILIFTIPVFLFGFLIHYLTK